MDFYFGEKSHSARFVDFLEGVVPTKASACVRRERNVKIARLFACCDRRESALISERCFTNFLQCHRRL